jgi:serine/threonine protein kinase
MTVTVDDFWKLLADSQLLTADQCRELSLDFGQVKGAAQQSNARTLAQWLISQDLISRYQAKILLAGRPGPFVYGEYHVCDRVKTGPLAGSFLAKHASTRHSVILLFLTGTAIQVPRLWAQIAERVRTYCEIVHPHLARCYELVDLTSFKFLVMEGLQGQALNEVLAAAGGRFAAQEACRIARQTALGLGQLHQCRLVRGDIRPASLWMEPGGNVKLPHNPVVTPSAPDLKSFDPTQPLLEQADYLAPELIQPGKAPDVLTDIYALGCTLYTLLAGQPPFPGGTLSQKMGRHATEPIQSLDTAFGVPQPVAQVVAYMMAKNPAVRYQTAADVANALGPYVDHSVVTPLPALAVPTLPAYEGAIMAKRARQVTQFAAPSTPAGQAAQPTVTPAASPIPVAKTTPAIQTPTTAPGESQTPSVPVAADGAEADAATQTQESDSPGASKTWFTLRNGLIAVGAAVILATVLAVATCSSCMSGPTPDDDQPSDVDDEGEPPPTDAGTQGT